MLKHRTTAFWIASLCLPENHVYRIIQVAGSSQNSLVGSIAVVSRSPLSSAGPLRAHSLVVSSERDC
jgi:hypothetical protein